MSTEIERRLSAALHAGAAAIDQLDTPHTDTHHIDQLPDRITRAPRRTDSRAWLAVAAAVVLVAAVTALAVGLRAKNTPPATRQPTTPTTQAPPSPTPTASTTASPTNTFGLHAVTCQVPMPGGWSSAFSAGEVNTNTPQHYNLAGFPILDVSPTGEVLSNPETSPTQSLVLVHGDHTTSTLYTAPNLAPAAGGPARIVAGQIDAHWVTFAISLGGGQGTIARIGVINRATNTVTIVRDSPLADLRTLSTPVLFDGRVYWSDTDSAGTGLISQYDPVTGKTATLDQGANILGPEAVGGGLYWDKGGALITYQPGTLPPGFSIRVGKINTLLSDNGTYAWSTNEDTPGGGITVIRMSRNAMPVPLNVYTSKAGSYATLLALSGPFVVYDDATSLIALDTRTGATTVLTNSDPRFSTAQASGGLIALNHIGSKGGAQLLLLQTTKLPELQC